jgi:hypothetical protein
MFTWFVLHKVPSAPHRYTRVEGIWNGVQYADNICFHRSVCHREGFIPLFCTRNTLQLFEKTLMRSKPDDSEWEVMTSNELHHHNHKRLLNAAHSSTASFPFRIVHTARQTLYSKVPHTFQNHYNVFLPLTSKYIPFIDRCGMTQGIAFIPCSTMQEAQTVLSICSSEVYSFLIEITRWGNFNSVYLMQKIKIQV